MKNENSNLPRLVDSHTHTQFAAFNEDYREVIDRALADDIWLINVGTQKDTSLKAVEIAEKYPEGVYATIGLHPIHTEKSFHDKQEVGGDAFSSREEIFDYDFYKKLGEHPKVLAIGECGFDFSRQEKKRRISKKKLLLPKLNLLTNSRNP
ncbi:MAG: TatD family hydrolase [Candidatus Colwellbacteria bacterium]|nr:TatD family hydrolase [Candidatus Colwellbacteria bacterium]